MPKISDLTTGSVSDADELVIVDGGSTKKATVSALKTAIAAGVSSVDGSTGAVDLSGSYAPLSGGANYMPADSIDLHVETWRAVSTGVAPTLAQITSRLAGWTFNASTQGYMTRRVVLPAAWDGVDLALDIEWCVDGGTPNGDVRWQIEDDPWVSGDSINAAPSLIGAATGAQPSAQYEAHVLTVATGFTLDVTKRHTFRFSRVAASGSDTETNTAAVLGVVLRKA